MDAGNNVSWTPQFPENIPIIGAAKPYTFDEYEAAAESTAIFPAKGELGGVVYTALGLCGEAGEVAEKIKKMVRDGIDPDKNDEWVDNMEKELGDVLWYLSNLANQFGITLESVARTNVEKLASRKARGVLQGSGDNR